MLDDETPEGCSEVLFGSHKPEQGSLGDNEMTVNGKVISAGMSGLTCKVKQNKTA